MVKPLYAKHIHHALTVHPHIYVLRKIYLAIHIWPRHPALMLLLCWAMITTNASFNKNHKIHYVLLTLAPVGISNSKTQPIYDLWKSSYLEKSKLFLKIARANALSWQGLDGICLPSSYWYLTMLCGMDSTLFFFFNKAARDPQSVYLLKMRLRGNYHECI